MPARKPRTTLKPKSFHETHMSNLQYTNHPADASTEDVLAQLALDLNWTLSRSADNLWRQLNAELWDRTHNPWAVLQTVSAGHLHSLLRDLSSA